jgi:hypothetical protein
MAAYTSSFANQLLFDMKLVMNYKHDVRCLRLTDLCINWRAVKVETAISWKNTYWEIPDSWVQTCLFFANREADAAKSGYPRF